MIEEMKKADRSANQSAENKNNFQKQYITAFPADKDTVEISVSDFEDYIRTDTKMQILTDIFEKQEAIHWETVRTILGVSERMSEKQLKVEECE